MISLRHMMRMLTLICAVLFVPAHMAFAQAYVPVRDDELITDFQNFANDFTDYRTDFNNAITDDTDSVRNLLAGGDPQGVAQEDCKQGNNLEKNDDTPAFAYTDGPWARASASSTPTGYIPLKIPAGGGMVQINYSHSFRCLLMEIVEWQKLGLSVQIHSLLKQYIADAQTVELSKQLRNRVDAANQNFGKSGNVVNNNGVISNIAVYNTNIAQYEYNNNQRQLEAATDQAAASPLAPGPQGTWGVCEEWRLPAAANMVRNARSKTEDPYTFTKSATQCALTTGTNPLFAAETDYSKFNANLNDPANLNGGMTSFLFVSQNRANSPVGGYGLNDIAAGGRIDRQQTITEKKESNSGYLPTTQYDPTNPAGVHSPDMQFGIDVNSASANENNINIRIEDTNAQIADATALDTQAGSSAEGASTQTNTVTGQAGANTLPLETSTTQVNQLIQEFYDAIQFGYFGIHQDTVDWARATMLMTYDEMKFDDTNPQTITTDAQAPVNTGN